MDKDFAEAMKSSSSSTQGIIQALAAVVLNGNKPKQDKEITTVTETSDTISKIIIPTTMSKLEASKELYKQHEEEETVIDAVREFPGWHYKDVLVAVKKATESTFGWMHGAVIPATFFTPKQPPMEIEVQVDLVNGKPKYEQCFYGKFIANPWDEAAGYVKVNRGETASIKFEVKKKFRKQIDKYFALVEEILKTQSIYRGKCLKYHGGDFFFIEPNINTNIVLNPKEELMVTTFIENKLGRFKKTTVLFTGPYGTGKTETAMRIGAKAVAKDITFVYCKNQDDYSDLLLIMQNYMPAVLFMEDVESIGGGEDRDADMNNLLNTLDGIETKGQQLLTIFTTNHENRINKALRRPGRIDLIVKFGFCEKETISKIYQKRFIGMDGEEALDYEKLVSLAPENVQGAVISAICDRAIDYATFDNDGVISNDLVEASIISIGDQIEFMKDDPEVTETPADKVYNTLMAGIKENSKAATKEYHEE